MKMGFASLTGELPVRESLGTGLFMWTPFKCKGKLKTELLVSQFYFSSCQRILYFMQKLKSNFNTIINGNQARQFLEEIEAMLLSYYEVIFSVGTNLIFVGKLF